MHGYVWYQLLKMPHVRRSQTKARYEEEKTQQVFFVAPLTILRGIT